jgi:anthranilate phosphoribosyltransferase
VHTLLVHGQGMGEISPFSESTVLEIRNGSVTEWKIDPKRYGFGSGSPDEIAGGPPAKNAATVLDVLRGEGNGASSAAVILNAAAALYVGGTTPTFDDGVAAATTAVKSGVGIAALDRLRTAFSRQAV